MAEAKDPAIKLFGKTIPVPEVAGNDSPSGASLGGGGGGDGGGGEDGVDQSRRTNSSPDKDCSGTGEEVREVDKDTAGGKVTDSRQEDVPQPSTSDEFADPDVNSGANENPKTPSVDKETATLKHSSKTEEEQSETSISQEKTLKKPDKIIPCPRCNSMDTKFCYYNNYNVNQPRHFCKNCQRYWTAGGTMRNVPVGAGRRKNKNSTSHYRHITVSEALQGARTDVPNGVHHHPALKTNGTVLTFGSDTPLCDSMASVLNIAEKTMRNCAANGFHKPEKLRIPVLPYGGGENGDDHLSKSSAMVSNSKEEACKTALPEQMMPNCHGFPPQMSCFPGAPWPYPWNSAQWSPPVPAVPPVPPPAFCPSGFPMPFYPAAAYWGCTVPGAWNIPWLPQPSALNHATPSSSPNSPTLGKHSRDENMLKASNSWKEEEPLKENNSERCLWIPKTLRIDDPGEAARSSIWATLGIKNDKADPVSSGRLFKPFQSKAEVKNHIAETSPVLQANPAALSRSLNFHESS